MIEPTPIAPDFVAGTIMPEPDHGEKADMPVVAIDMPIMYEDEGQENMGESSPHTAVFEILMCGIKNFLARTTTGFRTFGDFNLYYHRVDRWAYVSPDVMVVKPNANLPERINSYRIGKSGPAPVLAIEILSRRSFQQQDLTNKPIIYSQLGVAEYILIDSTAEFLPQRLLIKTLQDDGAWITAQDEDEGVTSRLGFRIVMEEDDLPRIVGVADGRRYLRPSENEEEAEARKRADELARTEAEARRQAEDKIRELEAEIARLRQMKSANGHVDKGT